MKVKIGDVVDLEVYGDICCEVCNEIIHNTIDCPVCETNQANTDQFTDLTNEKKLMCTECGATYEKVSDSWYMFCEAKFLGIDKEYMDKLKRWE